CINRYGSLQNLERNRQWASRNTPDAILHRIRNPENSEIRSVYAYLLGVYLGDGPKHERDIALEDWQQQIVDAYPLAFFRGLYHSDGSRFSNVVNGKDYPRYCFTNHSDDIRQLFCATCDGLGLHYTTKRRGSLNNCVTDVYISRRRDVEYLDRCIGPKT